MEKYVERMMQEHQHLVQRRRKLTEFIESDKAKEEIDKEEYALIVVQLTAMKMYESALDNRLEMHNISFNGHDAYYQQVQVPDEKVEVNIIKCNHCGQDADKNKGTQSK